MLATAWSKMIKSSLFIRYGFYGLGVFLNQSAAWVGAVLLAVFIMISTLRGKAKIANNDTMADEIEHLIDSLRKSESVRRDLLRELAHDLRTPIASLKSLIETARSSAVAPGKRDELLATADREIDYFAGLVDDLLFLGRVSEPRYKSTLIEFDLTDLIDSEAEAVGARYSKVNFDLSSTPEQIFFESDIGLVRRLVRNALENAFSFACTRVSVALEQNESGISILIQDDGKGFSEESLKNFGQRKFSRAVEHSNGRRISIGLGSVIMKSIVEAFRGKLVPCNLSNDVGETVGAELSIFLPR